MENFNLIDEKIGKNYIQKNPIDTNSEYDYIDVLKSWEKGVNIVEESCIENIMGLRSPQIGALCAIKSHWTLSKNCATIVMPTGTGKTETILSAIISERCKKTLIIVPSDLLKKQTNTKCLNLQVLRDIGVVNEINLNPIVTSLNITPNNIEELNIIISKSNIIISTMTLINKLSEELLLELTDNITEVIIDEAHHIPAKTWTNVKYKFLKSRILQFTATPYRNDGKKIDGDIIYNFPLELAQEQGYFKPIAFSYVEEYDKNKADIEIAKAAVKQLEEDNKKGFNHIILVRSNTKKRAQELYSNIYEKYYKSYNPIIITSNLSNKQRIESMKMLRESKCKILICVNMFGEGIDIPEFKIGAIHDKYKSLPITVQFIGRFARNKSGLGDATIIANIAEVEVKKELERLYSENSNWNFVLSDMSKSAISKEILLQKFAKGFNSKIVSQLTPKVSMIPYDTKCKEWNWKNWIEVFDESRCEKFVDEDKKILIILEQKEENVEWISNDKLNNTNWNIHIIYWNSEKKIAFINSSEKAICNKLARCIFEDCTRFSGEKIFRCLHGINRLMLGSVGLRSEVDGPIRYKMYVGVDIEGAITESQKAKCSKSNLFGIGYNGEDKISIGCSYKGTIWSRWVETIDFWIDWCEDIRLKIQNNDIDTEKILEGVLRPKAIYTKPESKPLYIEWPLDLALNLEKKVYISNNFTDIPIYECEIELIRNENDDFIEFKVSSDFFEEQFQMVFNTEDEKVYYKSISKNRLKINIGNQEYKLVDFFNEESPKITFADESSLEKELYIQINNKNYIKLTNSNKEKWDWKNTDIRVESQKLQKNKKSVQYKVIERLKNDGNNYNIIFDDDAKGEIADVVAIREEDGKIIIDLYHCKFSKDDKPGLRIDDLYELCGQAQKSIAWKGQKNNIIKHLKKRENSRKLKYGYSRLEVGDLKELDNLEKKLISYKWKMNINIVQPGVLVDKLTESMDILLCSTKTLLMETYGIEFKIIGS